MHGPENSENFDFDRLSRELHSASLPALDAGDKIIASHARAAEKYQLSNGCDPRDKAEHQVFDALRMTLNHRIRTIHSKASVSMFAGAIPRSQKVFTLQSGTKIFTALYELRSTDGNCLVSNGHRLKAAENGPVLLMVIAARGSRRYITLYSPEAFKEELNEIAQDGTRLLGYRYYQPLLMRYMIKHLQSELKKVGIEGVEVAGIEAVAAESGSFILATNKGRIGARILLDEESSTVRYKFIVPKKGGESS